MIFSAKEFVVDARHAAMSSFYDTDFAWTYSNEFFMSAYRMSYDCEFFSSAHVVWVVDVAASGDCKPYEDISSQVPEGSGNHNSTASTFNPSAEQMETLTVESPIPTASSPVPTACLNDSSETSSKARLVSKRVTHQEESPSLDYILSLTN
nr:hypothetical protein [Tanacetum cinerariifolium]